IRPPAWSALLHWLAICFSLSAARAIILSCPARSGHGRGGTGEPGQHFAISSFGSALPFVILQFLRTARAAAAWPGREPPPFVIAPTKIEPLRGEHALDTATAELSGTTPEINVPIVGPSRRRLGSRGKNRLLALVGLPWQRRLAQAALRVERIRYYENEYRQIADEEMKRLAQQFRARARGGESLDRLLPEVYGLVCVA